MVVTMVKTMMRTIWHPHCPQAYRSRPTCALHPTTLHLTLSSLSVIPTFLPFSHFYPTLLQSEVYAIKLYSLASSPSHLGTALADSEDADLLFYAAVNPSVLHHAITSQQQQQQQRTGAPSVPSTTHEHIATVPIDVRWWQGVYELGKGSLSSLARAKDIFTTAVQASTIDHHTDSSMGQAATNSNGPSSPPPHPLCTYMLGWIAELRGDLKLAENLYTFALQSDLSQNPLQFQQLLQLAQDLARFVTAKVMDDDAENAWHAQQQR